MITDKDKLYLTESGREVLLDIVLDSKILKEKLSFQDHLSLCKEILTLKYEDIIKLLVTEDIKDFESRFKKFLKFGFAVIASLPFTIASAGAGAVTGATAGAVAGSVIPVVGTIAGGLLGGAIGLVAGGSVAPSLSIFVLYSFRKITDTCSRKCFTEMIFSSKRKICRMECQIQGAKNIIREISSQLAKCRSFKVRQEACINKLKKEQIKWAKRLADYQLQIRQAKVSIERGERKKTEKELKRRAKILSASLQMTNGDILNIILENKQIRKIFTFRDQILLYHSFKSLTEQEIAVTPPRIDPKKEKWARKVVYMGLWPLPIPFFNDVVNFLAKKHSFTCMVKCLAQKKISKNLCYAQCRYFASRWTVQYLEQSFKTCKKHKKLIKCKKTTLKMIRDWKQRELTRKYNYEKIQRAEMVRARRRREK